MTKPFTKEKFTAGTLPKLLIVLSALMLLTYTILRAHLICMTHDESGSYRIWLDFDIFSCFFDPGCWRTANLHFLYVLLMQGTVGLFGDSEVAIRLPSLLGHLVYLYFSWRLVKMWSAGAWLALCGFVILNANPFLLEFFSLARGYGLAMTFMMVSVFYVGDFIKNKSRGAAWGMFIGAFLAVMSNYTMLNYYACMVAIVVVVFLLQYFNNKENGAGEWRQVLVAGAVVSVFMAAILYMPITTLSKVGEFEYGAASFWDTISSNVKRTLYGTKYLDLYNVEVFAALFIGVVVAGFVWAVRRVVKSPNDPKAQFAFAAFLLLGLAGLASIVQHYLLGVNYLVGRTALMFVPLTALCFYLFFEMFLQNKKEVWKTAFPVLVTVLIAAHSLRAYQFTHSTEWWYDSHTKAMLLYLKEKLPEGKKINLGEHWIFQPTSDFYLKSVPLDFCGPLVYEKKYRSDTLYDYYYIQPGDEKKINPAYRVEKRFAWAGVLMVRDTAGTPPLPGADK